MNRQALAVVCVMASWPGIVPEESRIAQTLIPRLILRTWTASRPDAELANGYRFERIVAALHEAALGQGRWPNALALIDDACEMLGSHLAIVGADGNALRYVGGWFCCHGRLLRQLERRYVAHYFQTDERVRRLLLLPLGCWLSSTDIYTARERETSPTYNEFLPRWAGVNQLHVRLDGLDGLHILWSVARAPRQGDWRSRDIELLRRLLQPVRNAVQVAQALERARVTP